MTKIVVKPSGKFMLVDPNNRMEIDRLRLVQFTDFVSVRIASGDLKSFGEYKFPDTATDADFQKFYAESGKDIELAIQSYHATFEAPTPVKELVKLPDETKPEEKTPVTVPADKPLLQVAPHLSGKKK
jgi:hypothetical protein